MITAHTVYVMFQYFILYFNLVFNILYKPSRQLVMRCKIYSPVIGK